MKLWTTISIILLVSACGFHLQGRMPLPRALSVVQIDAKDPQSSFVQNLRRALLSSGARITRESTEASAVIRVERDELKEHVLSVSSRNIPVEYEMTYTVRFGVSSAGSERIGGQDIALTREFSFDEAHVLAKQHEEDALREALARDLVAMVMRRLAAL